MYSRALLHRSFYINTAFWARRYGARYRNMCNLRFFAVRQRPMTPVLPRSLPRIMLRQILSCEPAPPIAILKGASPMLRRWASSVGTSGTVSIAQGKGSARATYKEQGSNGQTMAAAAQVSMWTGVFVLEDLPDELWLSRTTIGAGHFGRLLTAAPGSANAVQLSV